MGVRNSCMFSSTRAREGWEVQRKAPEPHHCNLPMLSDVCALINRDALPQLQGQTKLTAEEGSTSAHILKKEVSRAALSVWDEGLWGNTEAGGLLQI